MGKKISAQDGLRNSSDIERPLEGATEAEVKLQCLALVHWYVGAVSGV